jgi:hypothetical protein
VLRSVFVVEWDGVGDDTVRHRLQTTVECCVPAWECSQPPSQDVGIPNALSNHFLPFFLIFTCQGVRSLTPKARGVVDIGICSTNARTEKAALTWQKREIVEPGAISEVIDLLGAFR